MKQFLSYSLQSAYILFSKLYKLYFFLAISYAVSFQEDFALTLWEVIPNYPRFYKLAYHVHLTGLGQKSKKVH